MKPIPKVQAPPVRGGAPFAPEWYQFFQSLTGLDGAALQAEVDALALRVTALEDGESLTFDGSNSIIAIRVGDAVTIQLLGDGPYVGGNWYYGTNADGVRGFWPVADAITGTGSIVSTIDYGPYDFQGELDATTQLPMPAVVGDAYLIGGNLWVGVDDDGIGWENIGPANTTASLQLVGDEETPDPSRYYGTDESGVRGFHELPSGGVPYFIPEGTTFRVREYIQALFTMPIEVEGILEVDGFLVEVS